MTETNSRISSSMAKALPISQDKYQQFLLDLASSVGKEYRKTVSAQLIIDLKSIYASSGTKVPTGLETRINDKAKNLHDVFKELDTAGLISKDDVSLLQTSFVYTGQGGVWKQHWASTGVTVVDQKKKMASSTQSHRYCIPEVTQLKRLAAEGQGTEKAISDH